MGGERYAAAVALRSWCVDGASEDVAGAVTHTLRLEVDGGTAALGVSADGVFRLRAGPGATLPAPPEAALERGPWRPTEMDVRPGEAGTLELVSASAAIRLRIEPRPLALRLEDRRGAILASLSGLAFGPDGAVRVELHTEPGEAHFGLPAPSGPLDRRGGHWRLRNGAGSSDALAVSIPFLLIHRGPDAIGVFLDAFGATDFDVAASRQDRVVLETRSGGLDLMLFPGATPREVVRRFTARVGRAPLPPLWALGHHHAWAASGGERDVRSRADTLRRRGLAADALHLDLDTRDANRSFTWHPKRVPDPPDLLKHLAERGLRAVVSVDPGVAMDGEDAAYRDGLARDAYCRDGAGELHTLRSWPGEVALPDFNRGDVRDWWAERHRGLLEAGVSGVVCARNEPAGWRRDVRLGRPLLRLGAPALDGLHQSHPADAERGVPHEQVCNLYGLQHARATRTGLEAYGAEQRAFVLTRSGTTGIQRHAAVSTGGETGGWSGLRDSIAKLLGLSLSGVAFCGTDIGGDRGRCSPELYARWIQLGALYPLLRTQSGRSSGRDPWRFGPRVEAIAREALALRMRLLPYLYDLFREAETSGTPIWRPLFYEFPDDPEATAVDDQLMLGGALLLAPVAERGVRARSVYLPDGGWYAWHDGARYMGPRRLTMAAPLERLPLFVRAGSVLHTQSPVLHVRETPAEPCVLEVFPGTDASLEISEDDGETLAYRDGAVARRTLRLWSRAGGRLRMEIGRREGGFPIAPRPLRVSVHGCPRPDALYVDGSLLTENTRAPGWIAESGRIDVRLVDEGRGAAIEIDPAP